MRTARLLLLALIALSLVAGIFGAYAIAAADHHGKIVISAKGDPASAASDVVYITRTGRCYHRDGCSSLRKSKIKTTRGGAQKMGLRPCKLCRP